jgi:hypothetical protein
MSLWECPTHGLTGPTGCCELASRAVLADEDRSAGIVTTWTMPDITALRVDAERWRFILPLLGKHLRSHSNGTGATMYLDIGGRELETGMVGGLTHVLITVAVDAARAPTAERPDL